MTLFSQIMSSGCHIRMESQTNTTYLNQVCAPSGCVLSAVAALRTLQTCRNLGLSSANSTNNGNHGNGNNGNGTGNGNNTNGGGGGTSNQDLASMIGFYEYACTLRSSGATPAQNEYCQVLTNTWRGPPPCADITPVGCCIQNLLANANDKPDEADQNRAYVSQTCGIDLSVLQPCQPPGWANVTFAGEL